MVISVKYLDECEPRFSLIRMEVDDAPRFTFLGVQKQALIPAVAFMDGGWEVRNLSSTFGLMAPFKGASVVHFGDEFDLRIDYAAECALQGSLFRTPGAIVFAASATLLVARTPKDWRDPIRYLDLKSGELVSEPAGARAAFAEWSLFLPGDDKPLFKTVVTSRSLEPTVR